MPAPSDATLVRYLLGYADPEDEERLDELSVSDAAFAERLRAIEHDLADGYVRGELSGPDRERWETRYLPSQHGRDDLALAQALADRDSNARGPRASGWVAQGRVIRRAGPSMWWPLAGAAVLVLAVLGGYRITHHEQPPTAGVAGRASAGTPASPAASPPTVTHVAMTLSPSVRAIGSTPTLEIPSGTSSVTLTLRLEPDDHDRYDIALRDLTKDAVVWHADSAHATGADPDRALVVTILTPTFRSGRYLISVSAGTPSGRETIATYPFSVVLQ